MATTNDPQWANRMRMMSLHGINHDAWNRYSKEGSWYYEVLQPGFKYNLTDIAAAIGIEQLRKCDFFHNARQRIATAYDEGFRDLEEIERPVCRADRQHAWHLYVIKVCPERLRIDRNGFIEALKEKGIGTSVHFIPLHLHPYYKEAFGYVPDDFPNATKVFQRIISLPIYPKMTSGDVSRVIDAVRSIVLQYRR
jgi:perosamine synthetase